MVSFITKLPDTIFQHWIHSHEEDESDFKIFRNMDYDFPKSRLRIGFELKKDGTFIQYNIGSNDVPKKIHGNWELYDNTKIQIFFKDSKTTKVFEIITCEKNLLKLKEFT